jgi:hypothetical protein
MPPDEVEVLMVRLRRAGWNLGEVGTAGGRWLVSGSNRENLFRAEGSTPAEEWKRACQAAEGLGMLRRG